MFGRFSVWEIIIVLVLVILIFGGRKLPELGRSLGKGITNFRNALKNPKDEGADENSKDEAKSDQKSEKD
ncbi:MAG: twin-arginine translocase TatA/TatE family subunit [Deltaproteobacteria bacterium]|jgi:sec-independent protein translocase protein TatA|nr:twin-arginine translocase TatA/TatE family subunit [Deltaproteobacteria bacterium]